MFRRNPNLPNVITEEREEDLVEENLRSVHEIRLVFIRQKPDRSLRRALEKELQKQGEGRNER